ncbi:DNA sulfur modification protein DndB [Motilimonas eburnea]|uniref:DNA sulfur modification protein DndB n=1 Tax=Motilimonas eburnea TaxID=1737488 RepID=UPI001E488A4B|nr:DNA sulfur modification protein DndB [Motilimonas eburnea]MCE2571668.1 DGQHR domain-containing protein [Motilimonas eburnea]
MIDAQIELKQQKITVEHDLAFVGMTGNEGIGATVATRLTYAQFVATFPCEDETKQVKDRYQRNAENSRVKGIYRYLVERRNTVFPSVTVVVCDLATIAKRFVYTNSGIEIVEFNLPATSDRILIDGQGRVSGIALALAECPELADYHIDVKVIPVPTATLYESRTFIRQIFSDFHAGKKPNSSQTIFFDSATGLSRLTNELADLIEATPCFANFIARDGKPTVGQIFTLAQLTNFVRLALGGKTKAVLDRELADVSVYDLYLGALLQFFDALATSLPWASITSQQDNKEWLAAKANSLFCYAITFYAFGHVIHCMLAEVEAGKRQCVDGLIDFSELSQLDNLALDDFADEIWQDLDVTHTIEGALKVVRGSEKRLARYLCNELRIKVSRQLLKD